MVLMAMRYGHKTCFGRVADRNFVLSDFCFGPGAGVQVERGTFRGRLVIPCDHIEAGTGRYCSHVIYSDDHGRTWALGGSTPEHQVNECEVVELTGGRLLLNMRNYDRSQPDAPASLERRWRTDVVGATPCPRTDRADLPGQHPPLLVAELIARASSSSATRPAPSGEPHRAREFR